MGVSLCMSVLSVGNLGCASLTTFVLFLKLVYFILISEYLCHLHIYIELANTQRLYDWRLLFN